MGRSDPTPQSQNKALSLPWVNKTGKGERVNTSMGTFIPCDSNYPAREGVLFFNTITCKSVLQKSM